ncbi:MAG: hypothetical protein QY330_01255 [Candidatus Dojkabacteria bacterium]|uniref:DUF2975 domain-containing protein n=1 Tax=Candidatus Dojkabacteria bacterium TaxID=2099670 RepID=A0A952DRP5_9BACT|nr:hypothetical protein [Candidatus Dojkabacteria bacterium]WKZ28218.1 MAG: hypothetical protein QY330_01255 [Candidatus Dojkabacteria bacterium]
MTPTLVKLIDYSLLPFALLVFGKVVGLYLTASVFGIELGLISVPEALLTFRTVADQADLQVLSSYSDLFMFVLVATGFSYVLIAALKFHDTHIDIKTVNILARYNLLMLIKTSYELYHSAAVWVIFIWIATLVVFINFLAGTTYGFILIGCFLFSLLTSVAMLRDLFLEIELSRKRLLEKGLIS